MNAPERFAGPDVSIVEQCVLERMHCAASVVVTRLSAPWASAAILADQLVYRLEAEVLADRLVGDTKTAHGALFFPASPWQFFKGKHSSSWWLGWLVRRRPVRNDEHPYTATVTFERYATYPYSRLHPHPDLGRAVLLEQFR